MKLPRVYPILDTEALDRKQCPLQRAAAALLEAGAGILQVRHKTPWTREIFAHARDVARLCREQGTLLVINDRADIALLLEAGVHLGQEDLAPRDARKVVGPDAVLGYSTHNRAQLAAAGGEPVSYAALGPIFATASKRNPDPVVGTDQLRELRGLLDQPVVAIGGITRENAPLVWAAGADAVAVISDMLPENCDSRSLRDRMEEWQQLANK
jgi:thiamine-phosphate pyrophosphorylase